MRNLKLNSHIYNAADVDPVSKLAIDPITKSVYVANSVGIAQVSGVEENVLPFTIKSWESYGICPSTVVNAEVVTALNSLCVVMSSGDVITVGLSDYSVEVVGNISNGIKAACWSPDQEILTIVSENLILVMMTAEFEPLNELVLDCEEFGENKLINVGWGKKETQFHGKEGKAAALERNDVSLKIFDWDDRIPKITWRGDGQLVAVSYIYQSTSRRFKIINREGIIQSTCETVEGLEECLSWKPSGNLIASSQRLSNKHNIIFFEKNGLHHGGFELPFNSQEMHVKEITWNQDSSILALWLSSFKIEKVLIQFWKVGNYHWYLKETINVQGLCDMKWDAEDPSTFFFITVDGLHILNYSNCINASGGLSKNDNALVTVIDGNSLLITPFRQTVVPPPLSFYQIKFSDQIHSVMFAPAHEKIQESLNNSIAIEDSGFLENVDHPGSNSNNFCVFHGQDKLTIFVEANHTEQLNDHEVEVLFDSSTKSGFKINTKVHRVLAQYKLTWGNDLARDTPFSPLDIYNWNWVKKNVIVAEVKNDSSYAIAIFHLEVNTSNECQTLSPKLLTSLNEEVLTISSSLDGFSAYVQLINGKLYSLNLLDGALNSWSNGENDYVFPTPCYEVLICPVEDDQVVPLGLTGRNRLYLGNLQLLSNCTSVHIHTDHYLITTTSHNLLVVPKSLEALKSLSQEIKDGFYHTGSRNLERGSKIVTAVPEDTRVLLQMPRGNLELIHPRPLTIHSLKRLLNERDFSSVVSIMRRQRIDMNLIYDHNPESFLQNVDLFIRSVENAQLLDLFVASLNNEDITRTSYSFYYPNVQSEKPDDKKKLELICENLRLALQKANEEKYLLPILTTYVKSPKNEIHLALTKLKDMKKSKKTFIVSYEEGLRHLLYVADVNELCDVALGTYDFDLTMLVYERSQKDPKEYLPFLNHLKNLEENYRKYKINVHLKRHIKALQCMTECSNEYNVEFLSYIKKELLFTDALEYLNQKTSLFTDVCSAYGEYLYEKNFFNEAAAMYYRGYDLQKTLDAYKEANNWRRAIMTALEMKQPRDLFNKLCLNLIDILKSKNSFADAGYIYEHFVQNEEDAVEMYCEAKQWEDALLIAHKHCRMDLIETNIKPSALDQFDDLVKTLSEIDANFAALLDRLSVVRVQKKRDFIHLMEENDGVVLDSDLYSNSSTVTGYTYQRSLASKSFTNMTSTSNKTYRSSKNKRKLDRKKYTTKEGSIYEDLGIMVCLHEMITSVISMTTSVSNMNRFLITIGKSSLAKKLQTAMQDILDKMKTKKFVIWPNCAPVDEDSVAFGPQLTSENIVRQLNCESISDADFLRRRIEELEPQYRFPPNLDDVTGWKLFSLK